MNGFDFTGKRVLVVGGSSGIGNGAAQAFRAHGARVDVWGTRPSALDYLNEPGSDLAGLTYTQVDVADSDAVAAAKFDGSSLDVLVLCQGTVAYGRAEFGMTDFARVMDVNLNSMMACSVRFQPLLARHGGALIFISSGAAYGTTFGNPAYNASKAGILGLTRALAKAWIADGIRVNGVAPGVVETKLTGITTAHPKRLETTLAAIPRGRLGTPEDIAGAIMFLASPMADYVIGHTLIVDGGQLL